MTPQYYHTNDIGTVVALTDAAGQVTDRYAYEPFGLPRGHDGSTQQPFTYVGGLGVMAEADGLYFMRARFYDPDTGRFHGKDPVEGALTDPRSLHRYTYVLLNPALLTDPTGLLCVALEMNCTSDDDCTTLMAKYAYHWAKLQAAWGEYRSFGERLRGLIGHAKGDTKPVIDFFKGFRAIWDLNQEARAVGMCLALIETECGRGQPPSGSSPVPDWLGAAAAAVGGLVGAAIDYVAHLPGMGLEKIAWLPGAQGTPQLQVGVPVINPLIMPIYTWCVQQEGNMFCDMLLGRQSMGVMY